MEPCEGVVVLERTEGPIGGRAGQRDRFLRRATMLYAVGLALHTADHLRRGVDAITTEVTVLGFASTTLGLIIIALVFTRHRTAAAAAVAYAVPTALGVAAVHLLPRWSEFSDAFPGDTATGVTGLSWTVVLIEIAGLVALAVAGIVELRRERHAVAGPQLS